MLKVECMKTKKNNVMFSRPILERILRTVFVGLILLPLNVFAQSNCPYCRGTGLIKKSITVSDFGINTDRWYCDICKDSFIEKHAHISCPYCKGRKQSEISRSSNTRGNKDYSVKNEYVLTPEGEALCKQMAIDAMYGLPMTVEEQMALMEFNKTNPQHATQYIKWRNVLNSAVVYYNQSFRCKRWEPVKNLDNYHGIICGQLNELVKTFSLPEDLCKISQKLLNDFVDSYQTYRSFSHSKETLSNLEDQLIQDQLNRLRVGFW